MLLQGLLRRRVAVSIHVADEHSEVPGLGIFAGIAEQLGGRRCATAHPAGVDRQRPMMVHEEDHLARRLVAEPHPLHGAPAVVLLGPILRDISQPLADQRPRLLGVGDGQRARALQPDVGGRELGVGEHARDAVTLLEAHDVEGAPGRDEPPGAAVVAGPCAEEVPPEEVVRQHGDGHIASTGAQQTPVRGRLVCRAPAFAANHLCRRAPRGFVLERRRWSWPHAARDAHAGPRGVLPLVALSGHAALAREACRAVLATVALVPDMVALPVGARAPAAPRAHAFAVLVDVPIRRRKGLDAVGGAGSGYGARASHLHPLSGLVRLA
mmetsp:Transcript_116826/g.337539  ORF Transcript_116826/g.337539 Transcript_116826/m.337539 type:complete len:325 (+) Transcript_116826:404-1378(+)